MAWGAQLSQVCFTDTSPRPSQNSPETDRLFKGRLRKDIFSSLNDVVGTDEDEDKSVGIGVKRSSKLPVVVATFCVKFRLSVGAWNVLLLIKLANKVGQYGATVLLLPVSKVLILSAETTALLSFNKRTAKLVTYSSYNIT
jgi:hypothetical protein